MLDVSWTILFGLVGYWLRKMHYPLAPLVVALVLGDSTERELRKSLIAGQGNLGFFFSTPLSTLLMVLSVIVILVPVVRVMLGRVRRAPVTATPDAD
jgi:putative tricarboxylic transport membrane protein